jgi:hypothetical protein
MVGLVRTDDDRRLREVDDRLTLSRGQLGRHRLRHGAELPGRDRRLVELDRVGETDGHEVALLHAELGVRASQPIRIALESIRLIVSAPQVTEGRFGSCSASVVKMRPMGMGSAIAR